MRLFKCLKKRVKFFDNIVYRLENLNYFSGLDYNIVYQKGNFVEDFIGYLVYWIFVKFNYICLSFIKYIYEFLCLYVVQGTELLLLK